MKKSMSYSVKFKLQELQNKNKQRNKKPNHHWEFILCSLYIYFSSEVILTDTHVGLSIKDNVQAHTDCSNSGTEPHMSPGHPI